MLQHIAKVFAPFPFTRDLYLLSFSCCLTAKKKKVNGNLVAFRFYGGFCFAQFPMSLTVYFISCFETSDSKTLPVKCISQSDFDLLDFDID